MKVPLSVPHLNGREWQYVKECLDTGWVSSAGSFVDRFEEKLAGHMGTQYAAATVNGTAALHVALRVAGVEPDEEVLVSTLTFIAPVNAIRYLQAWPVFMDADPLYWQMDPEKVVAFLDHECRWRGGKLINKTTGRRIRALLPVHILGHPVDMDPLLEAAGKYELSVIEDATESLGSDYKGRKAGHLGDIGCFSFNGNKIITTGGGGMIVTDNAAWADRARYLTTQAKDDPVESVHNEIGYNYRLTNIQAALGLAQLEQLDEFVASKRRIAWLYNKGFAGVPGIHKPKQASWAKNTYWLYTVLVEPSAYGMDSRSLMRRLATGGIETRPFWRPVHRQVPYQACQSYRIEIADQLYRQGLNLPSSVGLSNDEQGMVIASIAGSAGGDGTRNVT